MNLSRTLSLIKKNLARLNYVFAILYLILAPFCPVSAASILTPSDTLSRLKVGIDADHKIVFTTPSGVAAAGTITVTFPSDFSTTSVDYTDIDVSDDGVDLALDDSALGATWGAAFGGDSDRTLTISSGTGTIAASSVISIEIGINATFGIEGDQAINNPTTDGTYLINIGGSFGDTGSTNVVVVTDDQIAVAGTIDNTLSFLISDHAIGFGSFATTGVRYATADAAGDVLEQGPDLPVKLTAGTNAAHGLIITIQDEGNGTSAGLYSTSASELIPADASTLVEDNSKKYGVYGKNAANLTIHESFDNDETSDAPISRLPETFASFNGPVNNGTVDVALLAAINATTKPGIYADTLTLICTGYY